MTKRDELRYLSSKLSNLCDMLPDDDLEGIHGTPESRSYILGQIVGAIERIRDFAADEAQRLMQERINPAK